MFNDAKTLEEFFDQMLEKWLPVYAFDDSLRITEIDENEDDSMDGPPAKRCKRAIDDK